MLSFIVIGRNEEKNLKRTIDAIYAAAAAAGPEEYEIIYVDSKSTDGSIETVQKFPEVKVFAITGEFNAAVARNAGAKESSGEVLFFIDGDMEISPSFLPSVWSKITGQLDTDIISGQVVDVENGTPKKRSFNKMLPGGVFIIRCEAWAAVGGMNTKFTAGEDYDLGLRLIEQGFRFVRRPDTITLHYTVPILDRSRIWKALWSKYSFYPRCVLLRDHLLTPQMYVLLWKNDKTFILLVVTLVMLAVSLLAGLVLAGVYLILLTVRAGQQRSSLPFLQMTGYFFLFDFLNLLYLFTFFPKRKREEWQRVPA